MLVFKLYVVPGGDMLIWLRLRLCTNWLFFSRLNYRLRFWGSNGIEHHQSAENCAKNSKKQHGGNAKLV
jgi:hypothetical protein